MIAGVVAGFPRSMNGSIALTPANSYWTALPDVNTPTAQRSGSTVTLVGLFKRMSSGSGTSTQVTILPVGYRPASIVAFLGYYNDSAVTITIGTDGVMAVPSSVTGTGELSIYNNAGFTAA